MQHNIKVRYVTWAQWTKLHAGSLNLSWKILMCISITVVFKLLTVLRKFSEASMSDEKQATSWSNCIIIYLQNFSI